MRRRLARFGLILLILAVAAFSFVWYRSPSRRINRAAFDRIQLRMTLEEVEAIIGCPPGNYAGWKASYKWNDDSLYSADFLIRDQAKHNDQYGDWPIYLWLCNTGCISVSLKEGRVSDRIYYERRFSLTDVFNEVCASFR